MKLKNLELTLENLKVIKIDPNDVDYFTLRKIKTNVSCFNNQYLVEDQVVKFVLLKLDKAADKEYKPFGCCEKTTVFERLLKCKDICQLDFDAEPDENEKSEPKHYHFLVHWWGDNDYTNYGEIAQKDKAGNLYIVIDKKIAKGKAKIEDYVSEYL